MPHPASTVTFFKTTLNSIHPVTHQNVSVEMASRMEANLSLVPPVDPFIRGSAPDGHSPWWPWFQARHQLPNYANFWVQGHLLNDNTYGPGVFQNLVPISNTLNSNMHALVESTLKNAVLHQGKYVHYVVQAHWDQSPDTTLRNWGMIGDGNGGTLLFGEHFAPTRLSWELYEITHICPNTGNITQAVMQHGSDYYSDRSQWNNHFPG